MRRRVRLLRGAEAERAARLTPGDRWEALLDASAIRHAADEQARAIVAEARAQAERLQKEAAAEGRERGMAAVSELLVAARAESARARRESMAELRSLAVKIADKLLGRALALDPKVVVDLAAQALEHAGEPRAIRLRCHPDDFDLLEHGRPRLLERCRSIGALRIEASDDIPRGGCVLESELGAVDARLATQLDAIERALRGETS
jgi:flagellar biosynthesis/type III secretory pathway protein FliH